MKDLTKRVVGSVLKSQGSGVDAAVLERAVEQAVPATREWVAQCAPRDSAIPALGKCQCAVLLAIYELESDAYGQRIIDWFNVHLPQGPLNEINKGQIYGTLGELKSAGFIVESYTDKRPATKGRPPIVYALTRKAKMALLMVLLWQDEGLAEVKATGERDGSHGRKTKARKRSGGRHPS